jgi:hypothetical protein
MSVSKPVAILSVVAIALLLVTAVAFLGPLSGSGVPVANAAPKKPVPTVAPTPIIIIIYCDPSGCKRLPASAQLVSQLHNQPGIKIAPESIPALISAPPSHLAPVQQATLTAR